MSRLLVKLPGSPNMSMDGLGSHRPALEWSFVSAFPKLVRFACFCFVLEFACFCFVFEFACLFYLRGVRCQVSYRARKRLLWMELARALSGGSDDLVGGRAERVPMEPGPEDAAWLARLAGLKLLVE